MAIYGGKFPGSGEMNGKGVLRINAMFESYTARKGVTAHFDPDASFTPPATPTLQTSY